MSDHSESVVVRCLGSLIASVYRPPSGDINEFFEFVNEILDYVSCLNLPIVLVGDFKIDLLSSTRSCRRFLDVIESFSC